MDVDIELFGGAKPFSASLVTCTPDTYPDPTTTTLPARQPRERHVAPPLPLQRSGHPDSCH